MLCALVTAVLSAGRIDWLKQGSRALFGTVVEDEIYILIDTSASMQHSIQFVKERLFVLMQVSGCWWHRCC